MDLVVGSRANVRDPRQRSSYRSGPDALSRVLDGVLREGIHVMRRGMRLSCDAASNKPFEQKPLGSVFLGFGPLLSLLPSVNLRGESTEVSKVSKGARWELFSA